MCYGALYAAFHVSDLILANQLEESRRIGERMSTLWTLFTMCHLSLYGQPHSRHSTYCSNNLSA